MPIKKIYSTERDKMLAGELYDCRDPQLMARHLKARELCFAHSQCPPADKKSQAALLQELFGHMGSEVWVEGPFFCDYGENIFLDDGVFINMNCVFLDCNSIHIGKHTLIGPNVQLYAVSHPVIAHERMPAGGKNLLSPYADYSAPIHIGNNCWLGGSVVVLQGVTIGDNVTIGAGSVVTKDIPDNVLAVGNPCRVVRQLPLPPKASE